MSSLCHRCENFDIQAFQGGGFEYRGYPLDGLIESAAAKCSFCSLLLEHLLEANRSWRADHLEIAMPKHYKGSTTPAHWYKSDDILGKFINGRIESSSDDHDARQPLNIEALGVYIASIRSKGSKDDGFWDGERTMWFHLSADAGTPAFTSKDITGKLLANTRTGIDLDFDAIRKWQHRCHCNHPNCKVTLSGSETFDSEKVMLPSRCIEIESEHGEIKSCILRETRGQEGKYIAMSHRWGPDTERVKTLRSNYDCRVQRCVKGKSSCQQCKTPITTTLFTHAYEIALKLGIKYVWIDSLCIVQDDSDDWKTESAKMADYYQHAWLTIAATRTRDSGGLFGELETNTLARVTRLPYRDRQGVQKGYFYAQCTSGRDVSRDYKNAISRSALLRRGWVYQEWLLSRRILAFADFGLFVRCQTGQPQSLAGDDVKFVKDEEDISWWDHTEKPDKSFQNSGVLRYWRVKDVVNGWRKVVEEYSGLELTKLSEDRLVALSGIASEYARAVEARKLRSKDAGQKDDAETQRYSYVCGSWFPEVRDLLWEQAKPGPRIRAKGIPTWSWASMGTLGPNSSTGASDNDSPFGLAVRWSNAYRSRPECELLEFVRVPLDSSTLQPQFEQAAGYQPDNIYGNDGRFAILDISGHLFEIRLHGLFADEDDCTVAGNRTGHLPNFGRDMWRRVTTCETPDTVAGWASLEHPDYQTDEACENGHGQIFALIVAASRKVSGGWLLGKRSPHLTAYEALFLRKISRTGFALQNRHCYERVMELVTPWIRRGGVDTVFVMPNLQPPITTVAAALEYKSRLQALEPRVTYLMSLYLHPTVTPEVIAEAAAAGIAGVKLYPQGVTTNSDSGVAGDFVETYAPVFAAMEQHDIVLNLHGEVPGVAPTETLSLEELFLPTLKRLNERYPKLRIVLEHCSTAAAIEAVKSCGPTVAGTITAHHLYLTGKISEVDPHAFCKPIPKSPADRDALLRAVGDPKFFFGSDSAPHALQAKQGSPPPAGVFTQPYVTQLVCLALEEAQENGIINEQDLTQERLEGFLSLYGRRFYKLPEPPASTRIAVKRTGEMIFPSIKSADGSVEIGVSRGGDEIFSLRFVSDE
ncbi:hypothetical protein F5Y16DRAFT_398518 [Xylariaceae sp. FL0255]|nr:hypothetical protein F5Y16DRAFT_398518 [Xylariaceae sp. FL0255]